MIDEAPSPPLILHPIGVVRSPFSDRSSAPRQPASAAGVEGTIELFVASGIEHALEDLATFRFIWVIFWFHRNQGFRPKVSPPRSARKRGVFATRAPYRPNPIGLSVVELLSVEGRMLTIRNVDMLDGTPVLDVKPYIAYTDSIPEASSGWLETAGGPADPIAEYDVLLDEPARSQLAFLEERGVVLAKPALDALKLGPSPHAYRRIKREGEGWVLAHKEWRLCFTVDGRQITVTRVRSGYRASEIYSSEGRSLVIHREFLDRFGAT